MAVPRKAIDDLARHQDRLRVILREILTEAGDGRVHLRAAKLLFGRNFAGRGLQKRRPGQEGAATPLHAHHVVAEARHICASRRGRAVQDRNDRHTGSAQQRKTIEQPASRNETFDFVVEKIAACAFHERHLLFARQHLRPGCPVAARPGHCSRVDAAVIHNDDAAHGFDETDTDNIAAPRNVLFGRRPRIVTGKVLQLEERHARIEQARQALARTQLATLVKAVAPAFGHRLGPGVQLSQTVDQRQHVGAIPCKLLRPGPQSRLKDRHPFSSNGQCLGRSQAALPQGKLSASERGTGIMAKSRSWL